MIFVVAEIGVNWNGDFKTLEDMFIKAKEYDCDAVKLQCFEEELIKKHPKSSELIKSSVSKKNIETIEKISQKIGIEWFATPMYPDAVKLLNPYVNRFKIRHTDGVSIVNNKNSEILKLILETDKEVIISSEKTPKHCQYYDHSKIKWLYCVPKYPSLITDLDFSYLNDFDGYSNHSPEIIVPITAAIMNSQIIEIHITSSKSKDYVDNPVSFDYKELEEMVKLIRISEQIKK